MKDLSKQFEERCKKLGLDPANTSHQDLRVASYLASIGRSVSID